MAVKLRLRRMGSKQRPFYRIVASDSRSPRDGRFIEIIGTYNPILKENNVTIDEEKVVKWINYGAQPTDTVKSLLSKSGVWAKVKTTKKKAKKTVKKTEEKKTEEKKTETKKTTSKKTTSKAATKKEGK